MSVYTELRRSDIEGILDSYRLGGLRDFTGIAAGIENSNFFIDTRGLTNSGRYVLTIFERINAAELPYFMRLMHHLAGKGVACPDVMERKDGSLLFDIAGKKGCIVSCLPGRTLNELNHTQLRSSGAALATLHAAGASFDMKRENPADIIWLQDTINAVLEKACVQYGDEAADLLQDELRIQQSHTWGDLPKGVIHGDMFVDNILFNGDQVTGIIDFYYAHTAPLVMDVAISLNAQAILLGDHDKERTRAFLEGYQRVRKLSPVEKDALSGLMRLAALRFWTSRLYDALFPRGGAMTQIKDPEEYRRKLLLCRENIIKE